MSTSERKKLGYKTDPYHELEYVVGSADDFVCFDFDVDWNRKIVTLGSCLNSETGHFIQDFEPEFEVSFAEDFILPFQEATALTDRARDWCAFNKVKHDTKGWNQDPTYFARCVHARITKAKEPPIRIPVKMKRRPINTGNYL